MWRRLFEAISSLTIYFVITAIFTSSVSAQEMKIPNQLEHELCPASYDGILCEAEQKPHSFELYLFEKEILKKEHEIVKAKKTEQKNKPVQYQTYVARVPQPQQDSLALNSDVIFDLVNQYRSKLQIALFEKDQGLCSLALERSKELYNEIFVTGAMHSGLYNRNLPYWITENMIHLGSEQGALNWWLNSTVHRNSIQGNYKYSCVACEGKSCSQLFTNYNPKQQS